MCKDHTVVLVYIILVWVTSGLTPKHYKIQEATGCKIDMTTALIKAFSFILLMFLGQMLKRFRVFGSNDHQVLARIIMNITLPAAVITSCAGLKMSSALFLVVLIGLGVNILLISLGWLYSRRGSNAEKAFCMINFGSYNIGAFAMPYLQGFLGPAGTVVACMFDCGNAVLCTGGSYALTSTLLRVGDQPATPRSALKKLFTSVSFDTYMIMLVLSIAGIAIPQAVLSLIAPAAAANPCIAMLLIGFMLQWNSRPGYLRTALVTVATRNVVAVVLSLFFYFCTPFPLLIRQVLVIILFAPISVVAAAYTEKCGGDVGLAGFTNSLSILVSICIITLLAITMFS